MLNACHTEKQYDTTEPGWLNYGKEGKNQFNIVLAENSASLAQSPLCSVS